MVIGSAFLGIANGAERIDRFLAGQPWWLGAGVARRLLNPVEHPVGPLAVPVGVSVGALAAAYGGMPIIESAATLALDNPHLMAYGVFVVPVGFTVVGGSIRLIADKIRRAGGIYSRLFTDPVNGIAAKQKALNEKLDVLTAATRGMPSTWDLGQVFGLQLEIERLVRDLEFQTQRASGPQGFWGSIARSYYLGTGKVRIPQVNKGDEIYFSDLSDRVRARKEEIFSLMIMIRLALLVGGDINEAKNYLSLLVRILPGQMVPQNIRELSAELMQDEQSLLLEENDEDDVSDGDINPNAYEDRQRAEIVVILGFLDALEGQFGKAGFSDKLNLELSRTAGASEAHSLQTAYVLADRLNDHPAVRIATNGLTAERRKAREILEVAQSFRSAIDIAYAQQELSRNMKLLSELAAMLVGFDLRGMTDLSGVPRDLCHEVISGMNSYAQAFFHRENILIMSIDQKKYLAAINVIATETVAKVLENILSGGRVSVDVFSDDPLGLYQELDRRGYFATKKRNEQSREIVNGMLYSTSAEKISTHNEEKITRLQEDLVAFLTEKLISLLNLIPNPILNELSRGLDPESVMISGIFNVARDNLLNIASLYLCLLQGEEQQDLILQVSNLREAFDRNNIQSAVEAAHCLIETITRLNAEI